MKVRLADCVMTDKRPTDWEKWDGSAWRVTLAYGRRRMSVDFFTGSLAGEPTASGVLYCLCADASGADRDFEDWAGDYGYDTDSRKAERIYRAVQKQTDRLRRFLGSDFERFVYADEDELRARCVA